MRSTIRIFAFLLSALAASFAFAADYPAPTEGDYTIRDFKFTSGETLPELRLHYRTLGKPQKDTDGKTHTRAVLAYNQSDHGITSWLAQPAPMGSLDYISPDAKSILEEENKERQKTAQQKGKNALTPVRELFIGTPLPGKGAVGGGKGLPHPDTGKPQSLRRGEWSVQGWPVHRADWKREILRSVRDGD